MSGLLRLERDGAVAELVLNRPEQRNAISHEMWRGIADWVAKVGADPSLKVLIVRGGSDFTAGADIAEFDAIYASVETASEHLDDMNRAMDGLAALAKPTIAMISGVCIGAGAGLAAACDLRFAAEGSRYGVTPAKLGMGYPLTSIARLVDAMGAANTSDLLFSGRLVDDKEAFWMGFVNRLFPADKLEAETRRYAQTVAANAGASHAALKGLVALARAGKNDPDLGRKLYLHPLTSPDFVEGRTAFAEKRKPQFR